MVELRHLRYFVAVAEELNFTRAAQRLHTSQPSLSQQIRILEDYLGIPLLSRSKRKVALTSAGLRFLNEARLALAQAEKAVIRARQSDDSKSLRIGFTPGLIVELLPQFLPRLRKSFPGIRLGVRSMPSAKLEQALKDEEFDIIFTDAICEDEELTVNKLFQESLIAVFPPAHPLASDEEEISLPDLQAEQIIVAAASTKPDLRRRLDEKCQELGVELDILHEVDNIFDAMGYILSGCGIGLFQSSLSRLVPIGLRSRRLDTTGPQIDVAVAYKTGGGSKNIDRLLRVSREIRVTHP